MRTSGLDPFQDLEMRLAQRTESLKPSGKRSGVESWFPYYAGYAPSFVSDTLLGLGSKPGWKILDPWNGSGTTSSIADQFGCQVFGYDINPVSTMVASARLARLDDIEHSSGLASELLNVAFRTTNKISATDPLLSWLDGRTTKTFRAIEKAILCLLGTKEGVCVNAKVQTPPPFASFFLLCLVRAAKQFAIIKDNSNPTWVTPEKAGKAKLGALEYSFLEMVAKCTLDKKGDVRFCDAIGHSNNVVALSDSKELPLPDASIDAVITSPPYCTRIDYFRATLFELAAIGVCPTSDQYRALRSKAMGTNLVRGAAPNLHANMAKEVVSVLDNIKGHQSKASSTYYYKHYRQYFDDAGQSLDEIIRVLKPGGTAVLVVQSSYYKDIPINLGDLFVSMGRHKGLDARVVLKVPVKRVLASINPHARRHAGTRIYTEDVVALKKEF